MSSDLPSAIHFSMSYSFPARQRAMSAFAWSALVAPPVLLIGPFTDIESSIFMTRPACSIVAHEVYSAFLTFLAGPRNCVAWSLVSDSHGYFVRQFESLPNPLQRSVRLQTVCESFT